MKYLQAKHPAVCWCLLPWFVEGNQTREEIFMELYERLETNPEDTYIEIALCGEICKGVLIGYIDGDHVWIWQAHAAKDFKKSHKMLNNMMKWAKAKGITRLKAECTKDRNERLIMRRFGFKKDGQEIIKELA